MKRIIKFYSPTCGPCMALDMNLKKAGVEYESVNVYEDESLTEKYEIRSLPTLVVVEDGNEVLRHCGVMSVDDIKKMQCECLAGTNKH